MSGGYARTKPTDVSKESSAISGELILDQVKKIVKFKHRDGRIVIVEGNNYDMFYEYLDLNFRTDTDNIHSGEFVPRLDKSAILAKRNIIFDADMNFERLLEFNDNPSNNFERISAHITVYDKDRDRVVAIMPKVLLEDVYTLVDGGGGDIQYKNLVEILADMDASFNDLYDIQLPKYLLTTTYTTDKATFFTKGALNETIYPTAKAMADILEADIKNLADNYLVKGSGLPVKYSSLKIFADDISTINASLSDTGSVGSKLKTVYENYIPKGNGYDAAYSATYGTIYAIVTKMIETTNTAITTKNNLADNYISKGTNWASKYGTYTDMVSILDKIITVSNKTDTNTTNVSNINDFITNNVLVKGPGFNTALYPNLLAITSKLEAISIPDVSVFVPKGALWSTKYTTYATMYDIMEYINSIATKENTFETNVGNTYFKYGAMTAEDKLEFPDMAATIDDIRANNTFRNAHTNELTQMSVHAKIISYVDTEIAKVKGSTTPKKIIIRHGGYCYGIIKGFNKPVESTPFNEDMAYTGVNPNLGIICSTKKIAKRLCIGVHAVVKHRGYYYMSARVMEVTTEAPYGLYAAQVEEKYYRWLPATSDYTENNDIYAYSPIYNDGDNGVIGYDIDFSGGNQYNVYGLVGSDRFNRLLIVDRYTGTNKAQLYGYDVSLTSRALVKHQDDVFAGESVDHDAFDRYFRRCQVSFLDQYGVAIPPASRINPATGLESDIRASIHFNRNMIYYNEEGSPVATATLASYSISGIAAYSSGSTVVTVKDGDGNYCAATVVIGVSASSGSFTSPITVNVPVSGTAVVTVNNNSPATGCTANLSIISCTKTATATDPVLAIVSKECNSDGVTIACAATVTDTDIAFTVSVSRYGRVILDTVKNLKSGYAAAFATRSQSTFQDWHNSAIKPIKVHMISLHSCLISSIDTANNNKLIVAEVGWTENGVIIGYNVLHGAEYEYMLSDLDLSLVNMAEEYEKDEVLLYDGTTVKTCTDTPHEYFLVKFKH